MQPRGRARIGQRWTRWPLVWLVFGVLPATHADPPLVTEEAAIDARGSLTLDLGARYRDQPRDFGIPDRQSQWDLGVTRLTAAVGEIVEVQLSGVPIVQFETTPGSETDFGDWRLGTKLALLRGKDRRPALGFLWEVKLPIASNDQGSGTDETDFFAHVLLSWPVGPDLRLHGNLGLGLLGDPAENGAQDDVGIGRIALEHRPSPRTVWGVELLGQSGFKDNDSPLASRIAFGRKVGGSWIHAGASAGWNDETDDFAVDVTWQRTFRFGRDGGP